MADRRHWDISRMCGRRGNKGGAYESRYFMYLKKKNIGKNAFRGIPRKASVYVPAGKMKSYRKWLKKAGLSCILKEMQKH